MDRVLRTYAHTAWTPADPLAGLDPEVRRAILLMPSTFRERWKLAPWTDRHQRRLAIADIVAERRLLYELTNQNLEKSVQAIPAPIPEPAPVPAAVAAPNPIKDPPEPTSPYYWHRLRRDALASMRTERQEQDLRDIERVPEAKADHDRRTARWNALIALEIERAKLDVRELEILAGNRAEPEMKKRLRKQKKVERGR